MPTTTSPGRKRGLRDSSTAPTVPPIIGSPSGWGGAYDRRSSIRPRMYGSSDNQWTSTSTCPSPGSGTSRSARSKFDSSARPRGRPASTHCWLRSGTVPPPAPGAASPEVLHGAPARGKRQAGPLRRERPSPARRQARWGTWAAARRTGTSSSIRIR